MSKNKYFDCITFFDENFLTNLRFEILDKYVEFTNIKIPELHFMKKL